MSSSAASCEASLSFRELQDTIEDMERILGTCREVTRILRDEPVDDVSDILSLVGKYMKSDDFMKLRQFSMRKKEMVIGAVLDEDEDEDEEEEDEDDDEEEDEYEEEEEDEELEIGQFSHVPTVEEIAQFMKENEDDGNDGDDEDEEQEEEEDDAAADEDGNNGDEEEDEYEDEDDDDDGDEGEEED